MNTILFLSKASRYELTPIFTGIRTASAKQHWNLQAIGEITTPSEIANLLDFWKPQGVIIHNPTNPELFPRRLFRGLPTVQIDLDPSRTRPGDLVIMHDSAAAGRLAARELLSQGLGNFAYARASRKLFWCCERFESFRAALRMHHADCFVSEDTETKSHSDLIRLREWLASLPKPIGIFASNDGVGEMAILSATSLGLSVPEDVCIVSVDDCEKICENTRPTLTSIHPDFTQAGFLAADLLARKLANPMLPGTVIHYGQSGIVRRQSSRRFLGQDARVNDLLEYIRVHAAEPDFSFDALAAASDRTLRCLEIRFHEASGRTLRDELHAQRVELAKRLLEQQTLPVAAIAAQSGFSSLATFARVFNTCTGMSPNKWRRSHFRTGHRP